MRVYKPSGIKWLGEIPKHWEVKKIKYIYKSINGFTPDTSNASYYDNFNGYDWITISDINKKYVNESEVKVSQKYIDKFHPQVTPKGSLLYSFKLSVGLVAFAKKDIYTNEAVLSFLNTNDVDLNFLYYSSFLIQFNAKENIYGAKLLNKELINNAFMVFPPLQEQKEIAAFLDSKCEKIQNYIEKKQKLITLLQEKKQALINEAVCGRVACHTADSHCHTERREVSHNTESKRDFSPTAQNDKKGTTQNDKAHTCHTQALPPCHTERSEVSTTAYKDRGIEYLELIPHHWEATNLKNIVSIKSGGTPSRDNKDYWNGDIPWIRSEFCHNQHIFQCDVKEKITTLGLQKSSAKMCEKNTILIALVGATIGQVAFLNFKSAINQNIAAIYPNNAAILDNVFLFFVALTFKQRFEILGKYAIANLAFIGNLKIPLPPLQEQKEIAAFLDSKVAQINSAIEKTKKQIELVKEYKNTLINEAVCGRIACSRDFSPFSKAQNEKKEKLN